MQCKTNALTIIIHDLHPVLKISNFLQSRIQCMDNCKPLICLLCILLHC
eukprot:Gb_10525 [translate_table: standard]